MSTVRTTSLIAGTSIVIPAALLALSMGSTTVDLPPVAEPARALAVDTTRSALSFAGGTAGSTTAFAGGTAEAGTTFAGSTVETAVGIADRTVDAAVPAALDTAEAVAGSATELVESALRVVEHGSATACPGAPVSTGVELRPGNVITLTRPLALQTPRAAVQTVAAVLDGTSVGTPSVGTLLSDPASVRLHGSGTGISVTAPVADEVLSGTSVQLGTASAQPATGGARSDAGTATELAPELEVGLGRQLLRLDESATVTTAGLGGPLTLRTTGGGSCTAVSWTITR